MCDECKLLETRRLDANFRKSRLENQLLSAGPEWTSIADEYAQSVAECNLLYSAYCRHQEVRHGVVVNYVGRLSGEK